MSDPAGQLLFRNGGTAMGSYSNVLITVAAGEASAESMSISIKAHVTMRGRYPQGYAHMIVTAATARLPSPEMRAKMQKTTREFGPHMLAHAIVLEGDGLIAASFRMVTQTMLMAVPKTHPHRAFGDVRSASVWVRDQCKKVAQLDASQLEQFVTELRASP